MNSRTSIRNPRTSNIVSTPQKFVTKQIHNQIDKKKYFNHRQSIFRELIITEDIVQSTLNKTIDNKSRFIMNKRKLKFNKSKQKLYQQQNEISMIAQQKQNHGLKLNQNFYLKFKQIANINRHFQKVCENKQEDPSTRCTPFQPLDIKVPINGHLDKPNDLINKEKQQLIEMKNNIREWKQKIKQGRNRIVKRQAYYPKIKLLRQQTKPNQQQKLSNDSLSFRVLSDAYFGPIRQQRTTAPVNSSNIEDILIEKRQKRKLLKYVDRLEDQPSVLLKQFIEGGQQSSYSQFSNHLSISQFEQSKQRFKTLSKMYNYIKEHNIYDLKDMNINKFDHNTMLSLVYFIQKRNNLSQVQKKQFKKKLFLID